MLRLARFRIAAAIGGAVWLALAAVPASRAASAPELPVEAERAVESIGAAELEAALRYLASDELEGRGTGHAGNERAAQYLASTFERLGVQPAAGGTFLQPLPIVTPALGEPNRLVALDDGGRTPTPLALGRDFLPVPASPSGELTAGLAFAGYGIVAADVGHDDYAGVDVRGRVVVAFAGRPRSGKHRPPLDGSHGTETVKARVAAERGAAALLLVPTTRGRSIGGRQTWSEATSPRAARVLLAGDVHPLPVLALSGHAATKLLGKTPDRSLDALQRALDGRAAGAAGKKRGPDGPASFLVPDRQVSLATTVEHRRLVAHNVLAMIEGADPARRHEVVVVGAHFDHDGVDEAGRIYNGADDGGSGPVGVLEIADAFARAAAEGRRPRRTVVFALWNAEEKGLLGSRHYVASVLPAAAVVVAKLNLDMVGRSEEVPEKPDPRFHGLSPTRAADNANLVHLLGYSWSPQLAAIVTAENAAIGLTVRTAYDDHEQNLLRRSDHWPFLQHGIPALYFTTGLHPDYHTPDDDVDRIEFEKLARVARLVFRTAWRVADAEILPRYETPSSPSTQ